MHGVVEAGYLDRRYSGTRHTLDDSGQECCNIVKEVWLGLDSYFRYYMTGSTRIRVIVFRKTESVIVVG
jgi:hypothetical protein